jgi:hypothetical protein
MTSDRRRQLELLLIVRRAERDRLIAVPGRRPPDLGSFGRRHERGARDDAADRRYVQQEQTRS